MKLFGWMHHKFRQNNGNIFKDFPIGTTCNCLCPRPSLEEHSRRPASNLGLFDNTEYGETGDDEAVLFEGLLSIGTLGLGPVDGVIYEEEDEEATEAELMVMEAELEKALAVAEASEGGDRLSSAMFSHAGGKGGAADVACPLQGYLFGSVVGAEETKDSVSARRSHRPSLAELFMMDEVGRKEDAAVGGVSRARTRLTTVKKLLQRWRSSDSNGGPRGTVVEANINLQKILQIFQKKVHPENTMSKKKHKKSKKTSIPREEGRIGGCGEDREPIISTNLYREAELPSFKSPSLGSGSNSSRSRETWIRTNSDYLVLEL